MIKKYGANAKRRKHMKCFKKTLALLLALAMAFSCFACGSNEEASSTVEEVAEEAVEETANELEWLNSSQTLPLVKDGTEKTLKIYYRNEAGAAEPEDTWFFQFIENAMNIDVELTAFTNENASEFLALTFADGDLPDLIIGAGLTTDELMKYGASEGLIMDLAPYVNETYMPNLTAIYDKYPEYKSAVADSEGHIWSLGFVGDAYSAENLNRMFINYSWLEECGLENPETLDEFVTAMKAFKELDSDIVPIGGSYSRHTPIDYLLNAFGYVISGTYTNGQKMAMRNGEPVLPVADREAYGEFLKFMNELYTEGLIHQDFFTLDKAATEAVMSEGKNGVYYQAPFVYLDNYRDWWAPNALTSEFNSTSQWPISATAVTAGNAIVSADCENPELVATFLDWFYTYRTYRLSTLGPNVDNDADYLYGFDGWVLDDETKREQQIYATKVDNYAEGDYMNTVHMWTYMILGSGIYDDTTFEYEPTAFYPEMEDLSKAPEIRYDESVLAEGNQHYQYAMYSTFGQNLTGEIYPAQVYLDEEQSQRVNYLYDAIKEYAQIETAKFVTGERSLDEIDEYFDEIEALGATEYVQIYTDYYNAMK